MAFYFLFGERGGELGGKGLPDMILGLVARGGSATPVVREVERRPSMCNRRGWDGVLERLASVMVSRA